MGRKRKGRSEIPETLIPKERRDNGDDESVGEEEKEKEKGGGFFACYLLTSLSPRHKGHTYIGFTVNPRRRIRQHNGEIRSGAWRTKTKRPWEMVLCIYGFPTNVSALQFEWAWQHPVESLAVRKAAANFKTLGGIANKVKLALTMLTLPNWESLNLTVNFFSTKYTKFSAGGPGLPEHMRVKVGSMDELPCYTGNSQCVDENEDELDDEEACEAGRSAAFTEEGLIKETNNNSPVHQLSTGEIIEEHDRLIDEIGMRQSIDCLNSKDHRPSNSIEHELSPFNSSGSCASEITEDSVVSSSIEETRVLSDMLTRKPSPVNTAIQKDRHLNKSRTIPDGVEIIDVLSPSPTYRTTTHSKKRRAFTVYPEIIDLTKSPIYV